MYRIAFLINPVSGGGEGGAVFGRLGEILGSFGLAEHEWAAEITEEARVAEQTDRLLAESRTLIAVGGDGTLGIVLDRVRRLRPRTRIGLIPLGTGNDLGRALGIWRVYDMKGLVACIKRLLQAPAQPFDLWDAGGGAATVVSYLSAGMDAAVLRDFDQARRAGIVRGGALGNKLFYLKALLRRARHRFPHGARARLQTPNGPVDIDLAGKRALLAANIDSYAAGAHPVPGNRMDDGLLEVVVFDTLWRFALVAGVSRILPRIAARIRLERHGASRITLELPAGTPVQIDGEDFTERFGGEDSTELTVGFAARVRLLDLRRSFYALF